MSDDFDDDSDAGLDSDPWDDDPEMAVAQCPNCGAEMYEDAAMCPVCGEFVTRSNSVWANRPWWWIVVGALGVLAMLIALVSLV